MSTTMTVSFTGGKNVRVGYDGFSIETDQSPDNGGEGSAPEPYDLFLASLASCAGVYVLGFCQRRELATDGIRVTQTWDRDPKTKRMEKILIRVEVPPSFPGKYLKALERAVDQCAVKKTILDPPAFEVRAVQG